MARIRNAEWAVMIVQRALELDPKKRSKFLFYLEDFRLLGNEKDQSFIKQIVNNILKNCEKPNADLRILGKAKAGLAKINDRENVYEKHCWSIINKLQPGDSSKTMGLLFKPLVKYCKRRIKKDYKQPEVLN